VLCRVFSSMVYVCVFYVLFGGCGVGVALICCGEVVVFGCGLTECVVIVVVVVVCGLVLLVGCVLVVDSVLVVLGLVFGKCCGVGLV